MMHDRIAYGEYFTACVSLSEGIVNFQVMCHNPGLNSFIALGHR